MPTQVTAAHPVPLPRPPRTIPVGEFPVDQIGAIDHLLQGSLFLPSCDIDTDLVKEHLVANYGGTPVICRVGDNTVASARACLGCPERYACGLEPLKHVHAWKLQLVLEWPPPERRPTLDFQNA